MSLKKLKANHYVQFLRLRLVIKKINFLTAEALKCCQGHVTELQMGVTFPFLAHLSPWKAL